MIFEDLASLSLEDAAKECAGNYRKWQNYVWWGELDAEKPEDVCIINVVNNSDPSVRCIATLKFFMRELKNWWCEDITLISEKTVCSYGANFHGQKDMLSGFMIRVYDAKHHITPAFKKMHELIEKWEWGMPFDEDLENEVNKEEVGNYVRTIVEYELKNYSADTLNRVITDLTNYLVDEEEQRYDEIGGEDDEIIRMAKSLAEKGYIE